MSKSSAKVSLEKPCTPSMAALLKAAIGPGTIITAPSSDWPLRMSPMPAVYSASWSLCRTLSPRRPSRSQRQRPGSGRPENLVASARSRRLSRAGCPRVDRQDYRSARCRDPRVQGRRLARVLLVDDLHPRPLVFRGIWRRSCRWSPSSTTTTSKSS